MVFRTQAQSYVSCSWISFGLYSPGTFIFFAVSLELLIQISYGEGALETIWLTVKNHKAYRITAKNIKHKNCLIFWENVLIWEFFNSTNSFLLRRISNPFTYFICILLIPLGHSLGMVCERRNCLCASQLQLQGPSRLCKASVNAVSNKKYAEPLRHGLQAVYYDIHVSTHSLLLRLLSDSCSGSRECSKFPVEEHLCSSSAECTSEITSSKCMSAIFKHTFYLPYHEA